MRVAILGGAFNPPHRGHVELARFVLDNCPVMDEVLLMPCYTHAHNKKMIEFEHRYEMCKLASEGYHKIQASDFERKHSCSYTYEMLTKLKEHGLGLTPYMVIGMDEANNIKNWNNWEKLIKEFRFIVVDRGGVPKPEVCWWNKGPHIYLEDRFNLIPAMCSSIIRDTLSDFEVASSAYYYLNPSVLSYIKEHKLYGRSTDYRSFLGTK